jgi:hypothetical protein
MECDRLEGGAKPRRRAAGALFRSWRFEVPAAAVEWYIHTLTCRRDFRGSFGELLIR